MYHVCTMYTTAVGVILPRQLACCLHRNEYDIWCNVCWTLVWGRVIGKLFEGKCWRGNVCGETLCSLRSHGTRFAYGRLRAQALSQPCLVKGRAKVERFVFATNGTIERFGNLVHQELMNVWRDSILFASLTRHTIVANATIKTVPCQGKSGCLCLRRK